jgi:GNAT superfamily N-acetyltransferase
MEDIHIEQIRPDLTWRIRHEVMYPDAPLQQVKLDNDTDGTHFGLFLNGYLTSVVSLFNDEDIYQFRKFATLVSAQGNGYGTKLLEYIIDFVIQRGGKRICCNARLSAVSFYERFGFQKTDQYFTKDGQDFVVMAVEIDT